MDPRRHPSDASSNYSGSTGSVWSTTDSVSFVYTDDPYWAWWGGYEGVRGAVTRKEDRRDDRRIRLAAHFLRGPFAGHKSKKQSSHHRRDSDSRSNYSSSSGSSSSTRRHRQFPRSPSPMPPPPHAYPGPPNPHQQHPQQFGNFHPGPPMGMGQPPPPMAGPPPQPGFEAGFIQLGGGGGGPPPHHRDPVWGHDAHYDGEPEVWD
ncbi:hypothetical protein GQX73_g2610 [Xylaria multiplex]|uniref:Uncharacterized protein n=1 Tax=Xylaria multiplex TaxID=323545 RepID=A0A7C8MW75_9PEZI|nr:hypothetical protein GQX73_g2610 [Xylaria multiplex]